MGSAPPRSGGEVPVSEGLVSIWARRALTVPGYLLLAAVCWVGLPLWMVIAALGDLFSRQASMPKTRALAFFAVYLGCEAVALPVALLLGALTLGGRLVGRERYIAANAAMQRWWSSALFNSGARIFSWRVEVEGLDAVDGGPLLLFVRHSSVADTLLAAALFANPNRLLLRYVVKKELLWDPCLDIVGRRLPNAFIDRRSGSRERELAAITSLAHGLDERSAVLIYPEGTRFSAAKRRRAIDRLVESGRHDLAELAATQTSVLPPRLAGSLTLLEAAPDVDVVFLEHSGLEGASSFREFGRGALIGATLRVRFRRVPAAEIPRTGRDRWLFEQWDAVDAWVRGGADAQPEAAPGDSQTPSSKPAQS